MRAIRFSLIVAIVTFDQGEVFDVMLITATLETCVTPYGLNVTLSYCMGCLSFLQSQ